MVAGSSRRIRARRRCPRNPWRGIESGWSPARGCRCPL